MGVDFFFVLSGMLMSKILFEKNTPLNIFYKRRISRIFPVFFIYLSTISIWSAAFNLSNEHKNFFYNLFFLRTYFPENPGPWSSGLPLEHLWSLNVEEHSYIFLSTLVILPFSRSKIIFFILLTGLSSILLKYLYFRLPDLAPPHFSLRTETSFSFILLSTGYYLIHKKVDRFVPSWAPAVSVCLAILCYTPYSPHWTASWTLTPIFLTFSISHLGKSPAPLLNILKLTSLRMIGVWSFSIYLWQQPLIPLKNTFPFAGGILAALSIIIGIISFYGIEDPARKYLNKKWQ